MDSKNFSLLTQFTNYCAEHPQERFWQALLNWSGNKFILVANDIDLNNSKSNDDMFKGIRDTFYFKGKTK